MHSVVLFVIAINEYKITRLLQGVCMARHEEVVTQLPEERVLTKKTNEFVNPIYNIILNAVPKSGSSYIAKSLDQGLNYERMRISAKYIPKDQVNYFDLQKFYSEGGKLSKQHLDPSTMNVNILKRFTRKMVLQLRDPREILLSWVHHLNALKEEKVDLYYFDPEPSVEYYNLSLNEQIDWNIENFLPSIITWIDGWLIVKEKEDLTDDGLKILITTYDEFLADELKFYHKILNFYDIPISNFKVKPPKKDRKVHFRKGELGEWRSVFTKEQKRRIAKIVPDELLRKFNWEK